MRYMPTLRSPVSGSLVTTHGNVMKRPPSSGQHFWMGKFARVGQASSLSLEFSREADRLEACPTLRMSGAAGHGSLREAGASYLRMTSLHEPLFTVFGFAWRKSSASE